MLSKETKLKGAYTPDLESAEGRAGFIFPSSAYMKTINGDLGLLPNLSRAIHGEGG